VTDSGDIFATGPQPQARIAQLDGQIPVMLVDDIFADPLGVREMALGLPYEPAGAHYPGRKAQLPEEHESLARFLGKVRGAVEQDYLPRIGLLPDGRRPTTVGKIETDFAITDVHPSQLTKEQTRPHIDHVPFFGLIYLNPQDRGGTLFFRAKSQVAPSEPRAGYQVESDDFVQLCGKIEGRFNRLAVYPGFILHTGEVKGWIETQARFDEPRLTQRIMFFL
jgi:hypothetical protein